MAVSVQHTFAVPFSKPVPPPSTTSYETLADVLTDNHKIHHVGHEDQWTNGLSSVLLSAYDLGADATTLRNIFTRMAGSGLTRSQSAGQRLTEQNWTDFLGQRRNYRDYVQFFDSEISRIGPIPTFQLYFPTLMPGLLGSSLQPLIHLGLGLTHQSPLVISEGLAYAAVSYFVLPSDLLETSRRRSLGSSDGRGAAHILQIMRSDSRFQGVFEGSFTGKLRVLTRSRADLLRVYVDEWGLELSASEQSIRQRVRDLSRTTAALFATARAVRRPGLDYYFATLFAATRGLATILHFLPDGHNKIKLLKMVWLAIVSTFVIQGRPAFTSTLSKSEEEELSWEQITEKTLASNDVLIPVLVRSLREAAIEEESEIVDGEIEESDPEDRVSGEIFVEVARMIISSNHGGEGIKWSK